MLTVPASQRKITSRIARVIEAERRGEDIARRYLYPIIMVLMQVDPAIEMDSLQKLLQFSASSHFDKAPQPEPRQLALILASAPIRFVEATSGTPGV